MRGLRLSDEEWATLQVLGGAEWLRERLKRARLTPEQSARLAVLMLERAGQTVLE